MAADDALAHGGNDPELVHRARVAIRRLRSVLRTFRPMLEPNWTKQRRDRLRRLSEELSAARDADIILARARNDVQSLDAGDGIAADGIFTALSEARDGVYARVREVLRDADHLTLPRELAALIERPAIVNPDARLVDVVGPILEKTSKRLRNCVRRASKPPTDEELHAIRIAAKHVRYALEACEAVIGRRGRRAAKRVERLQDVLGEEHDATFSEHRLRELGAREMARIERKAAARARSRWRRCWRSAKRGLGDL